MMRSTFAERGKARNGVRLGVLLLAAMAAFPGIWALFWPHSFFMDFPGLGQKWVATLPPYNEHLVRDVGSFYLAFAVLLGGSAASGNRRVMRAALLTSLVFSIPHAVWHSQHVAGDGLVERWGSVATLGGGALLALVLLIVLRRR